MEAWALVCAEIKGLIDNNKQNPIRTAKALLTKIDKMLVKEFTKSAEQVLQDPMTQEEVENWILLKSQTGERWFEIRILDPEVQADPTVNALMETISEMIHKGMLGLPFEEGKKTAAPDLSIVKPGGRSVK